MRRGLFVAILGLASTSPAAAAVAAKADGRTKAAQWNAPSRDE